MVQALTAFTFKLALVCLVVFGAFTDQAGNCTPSARTGWEIRQETVNVGTLNISFTDSDYKCQCTKLGISFFMHAPEWQLTAYNTVNKKFLSFSRAEALDVFQLSRRSKQTGFDCPIKVGKGRICDMPVDEYVFQTHPTLTMEFASSLSKALATGKPLTTAQKQYVAFAIKGSRRIYSIARDIPVPKSVSSFFIEHYAFEEKVRLPLKLVQINRLGRQTVIYETTAVKKVNIAASVFKEPKGYKKATDKVALLVDENDSSPFGSARLDENGPLIKANGKLK